MLVLLYLRVVGGFQVFFLCRIMELSVIYNFFIINP